MRCSIFTLLILTTLTVSHVYSFPALGKTNVEHEVFIQAKKLAEMVKRDETFSKRSTPLLVPDPNDEHHQFIGG